MKYEEIVAKNEEEIIRAKMDGELLKFVDDCENSINMPIGVRGLVRMGRLYIATIVLGSMIAFLTSTDPKLHGRFVEMVGWGTIIPLVIFIAFHVLKGAGRILLRLIELAMEPVRRQRIDTLVDENRALKKKLAEYAPIVDGGYREREQVVMKIVSENDNVAVKRMS